MAASGIPVAILEIMFALFLEDIHVQYLFYS